MGYDPVATGDMIRQLRERAGLGLRELAELAGVDEEALVGAESAQLDLDSDGLLAVADALSVSPLGLADPASPFGRLALTEPQTQP